MNEGETDGAIDRLLAATEADPSSPLFLRWLGEAYVQKIDEVGMLKKLGTAKRARTSFERAVQVAPADFESRRSLVGYYLNAPAVAGGSRDKAAAQVEEVRKIDPAKGHLLQGRIDAEAEEWDSAAVEYRAAMALGEDDSRTHYWLGFALQQAGDYEAALAAFESAIEIDANNLDAYYQIGRTAIFAADHLDRGVECLRFYLGQPPRQGVPGAEHAHWRLGMIYELQGRDDQAAAEYRIALAIDPGHKESKRALASLGSS